MIFGQGITSLSEDVTNNFNLVKVMPEKIKIKTFNIDHVNDITFKKLARNTTLLMLILIGVCLAFEYVNLNYNKKEIEIKNEEINKINLKISKFSPANKIKDESSLIKIKEANEVIEEFGFNFSKLFIDIESVSQDKTSFLVLNLDSVNKAIIINGQAKSAIDLNNYIKELENSHFFKDVFLTNHQIKITENKINVLFNIKALLVSK